MLLMYFHGSNHMFQVDSVTGEGKRHLSHLNQTGRKQKLCFQDGVVVQWY